MGKLFRLGQEAWYCKGLTYGPFAPNADGHFLPARDRLLSDLDHIRRLGANTIRLYHVPPRSLLDELAERDLRVFLDVPWEKHRCFFEDWAARDAARRAVERTAAELGTHPAVFAIGVANEIPHDVVRFYGADRVSRFVNELIDVVHQVVPDCLATYTGYPSTEFLCPSRIDFYCINVYLNDPRLLGIYLERLQHIAGHVPLVLGEHGLDAMRHGEATQAATLSQQVRDVFRRGAAGSFVFSYSDDWFTGGHQIEDWAFGITDRARQPKPAAAALSRVWTRLPQVDADDADRSVPGCTPEDRHATTPRVSVVVCSYNGAATLDECLASLTRLDYPDYEVILVDDGSTDDTPAIARRYPTVLYVHQPNRGLSAARNVGLHAATGDIIAYTDSDCVAEPTWLTYLVMAMQDQGVHAIGGPNVPPPEDNWVAACVAASPGGPSHVMLDDRHAEHVPGCNMAFDRRRLLELGGFDVQFHQAGDDVDICWRLIDAGLTIGYAPAALVWHHRRNTVRAYLKQQKGYGRSEAMLHFKHPQRFNVLGASRWLGVIYGEGAVGLPVAPPAIYHGRFGMEPFQIIYRRNQYSPWAYVMLLEWHASAALLLAMAPLVPALGVVALCMLALALLTAARAAARAPLPTGHPWWCGPLVFVLNLVQPVVRSWHRYAFRFAAKGLFRQRAPAPTPDVPTPRARRISRRERDLYWASERGLGREHLLDALVTQAEACGWRGDFHAEWQSHDVELWADVWHNVRVRTATEELGWPRRFTRARCAIALTRFARAVLALSLVCLVIAAMARQPRAAAATGAVAALLLLMIAISSRRCFRDVAWLLAAAGAAAGLEPYLETVPARGAVTAARAARSRPPPKQPSEAPARHTPAGGDRTSELLDSDEAAMPA